MCKSDLTDTNGVMFHVRNMYLNTTTINIKQTKWQNKKTLVWTQHSFATACMCCCLATIFKAHIVWSCSHARYWGRHGECSVWRGKTTQGAFQGPMVPHCPQTPPQPPPLRQVSTSRRNGPSGLHPLWGKVWFDLINPSNPQGLADHVPCRININFRLCMFSFYNFCLDAKLSKKTTTTTKNNPLDMEVFRNVERNHLRKRCEGRIFPPPLPGVWRNRAGCFQNAQAGRSAWLQ